MNTFPRIRLRVNPVADVPPEGFVDMFYSPSVGAVVVKDASGATSGLRLVSTIPEDSDYSVTTDFTDPDANIVFRQLDTGTPIRLVVVPRNSGNPAPASCVWNATTRTITYTSARSGGQAVMPTGTALCGAINGNFGVPFNTVFAEPAPGSSGDGTVEAFDDVTAQITEGTAGTVGQELIYATVDVYKCVNENPYRWKKLSP